MINSFIKGLTSLPHILGPTLGTRSQVDNITWFTWKFTTPRTSLVADPKFPFRDSTLKGLNRILKETTATTIAPTAAANTTNIIYNLTWLTWCNTKVLRNLLLSSRKICRYRGIPDQSIRFHKEGSMFPIVNPVGRDKNPPGEGRSRGSDYHLTQDSMTTAVTSRIWIRM